jgi:hypothetical protein
MQDWKRLLRARDFRVLWFALIADDFGTWCVVATLPILVAERFDAGNALVVTFGMRVLPRIVLAPVAGFVLQRFGIRLTGTITLGITGLITAAMPWCSDFFVLQAAVLATGILDIFAIPALLALRTPVTPRGLEMAGNTLFAAADRAAKFVGPAIGGAAISIGLSAAYAGFGLAMLLAAMCVIRLPSMSAATPDTERPLHLHTILRDFVTMLRHDRMLRGLLYCAVPYMVTFGGMRPFLFWANVEWFGASNAAWTALLAAQGIGALIGAVVSGLVSRNLLRLMSSNELRLLSSLLEGLAHIALLGAGNATIAMALLVVVGIPEMLAYAAYFTVAQERLAPSAQTTFYSLQQPLFDVAMVLGIASASLHANQALGLGTYWLLLSLFSTVPVVPLIVRHWRCGRREH